MILPTKYMDLQSCVLRLAALTLTGLREAKTLKLDEVERLLFEAAGENGRRSLPQTLSFLYLLGKVTFIQEFDAIALSDERSP